MNAVIQNRILNTVSRAAGITVVLEGNGEMSYDAVLVEKKKGILEITDRKRQMSEESLKAFIPKGYPVVFTIEGWGVLVKEANFDEEGRIAGSLMPNIEDFETYPLQKDGKGYVSIIRKELLEGIKEKIGKFRFDILSLSAGSLNVSYIIPALDIEGGELLAGNRLFSIKENAIAGIRNVTADETTGYKMGNDIISSCYLAAFASVVKFFSGFYDSGNSNQELLEEFAYKKLTVFSAWGVLSGLLLALLINFLVFDSLSKQYDEISIEYRMSESVLEQLKTAEAELKKVEELVEKGGLDGYTRFAWCADRIVELMPEAITLTNLGIQPVEGKIQRNREIGFRQNTIVITGETSESLLINRWIDLLKNEEWISEVQVQSYSGVNDNRSALFGLEISFRY